MKGRILVTDDDAAIRTVVREALRREGHTVEVAASVAEQRRALAHFRPQVLVTDVVLPDGNGLEVIDEVRRLHPNLPIIVLSAQNTFTTALRATEQGAFDYLPKPFDLSELTRTIADALAAATRDEAVESDQPGEDLPLIGRSPPMQEVYRTIARVVANDLTILILGESGTGKELVAKAIHDFGPRASAPFVPINMAAIPRDLIESELFGHERGAFTGAAQRNAGRFEQAQGGTLFLDEIGDMPAEAQTRLLRVLQSGEYTPVGSARAIRADVRIIAATHQDLSRMIAEGTFREDLYYRLNVVPIRLPALRDRGDDVAELARHFLDRAAADGLPRKSLDVAAAARLTQHSWPGNVRELENLMRRLAALGRDPVIGGAQVEQQLAGASLPSIGLVPEGSSLGDAIEQQIARHIAGYGTALPPDGLYDRILAEVEKPLFKLTLAAVRGNQLRAAKLLGLNRNTLRKKLTEHGVGPQVRRSD
ncbi:two-component system nitrogen regulation response regulator GlnG [Sphingomonas vulcanisoli]|uniref:DNA-binding transcriptional regulator NtrC n=1 Tax=Sphingomonas vulcanisoli TaxID=1658060 RepID=A0ABX0TPD0_9SPHN|nr:nitrogen regulation protein NR(I) [Sphingomonas vulcanisoli]NIJ06614.1 two-component system nitrogen regulation response regulator GlnG [Sphingomonas vulcanisoli]